MPFRPQSVRDLGKISDMRDSVLIREEFAALLEAVQALAVKIDAETSLTAKTYRSGLDAFIKLGR